MVRTLTDPATGAKVRHVSRAEAGLSRISRAPSGRFLRPHAIAHHGVGRGNGLSLSAVKSIWRGYYRYHTQNKKWSDIAYTHGWADAPDVGGALLDGRKWMKDGAHTQRGRNRDGYACSYIGDGRNAIANTAWRAWRAWLWFGIRRGAFPQGPKLSGHSDWWSKLCPGPDIIGPLEERSKFDLPDEENEMATPTQVVITETEDESHEKPLRRILLDYATRTAHHIRSSSEDEYWRNMARAEKNPEVAAGGRWSRERLRMHCANNEIQW